MNCLTSFFLALVFCAFPWSVEAGPYPSPQELFQEAQTLARQGSFEEATKHLETALFLDPDLAGGWSLLGFCFEYGGDKQRAIKSYQEAVKRNGLDDYARSHLRVLIPAEMPSGPQVTALPPALDESTQPSAVPTPKVGKTTISCFALGYLRTGRLDPANLDSRYGFGMELVQKNQGAIGLSVTLGHRSIRTETNENYYYFSYGSDSGYTRKRKNITYISLGPRFFLNLGKTVDMVFGIGFGGAYWIKTVSSYSRYYYDYDMTWHEDIYGPETFADTGLVLDLGADIRVKISKSWGISARMRINSGAEEDGDFGLGGSVFRGL